MKNETLICTECGEEDLLKWGEPCRSKLIKNKVCFSCDFWLEHIKRKNSEITVIVENVHYKISSKGGAFKGFSGRKFKIKFFDGREIETNNLWCQGTIDKRFRDRLPDNAEFIKEEQPNDLFDDLKEIP